MSRIKGLIDNILDNDSLTATNKVHALEQLDLLSSGMTDVSKKDTNPLYCVLLRGELEELKIFATALNYVHVKEKKSTINTFREVFSLAHPLQGFPIPSNLPLILVCHILSSADSFYDLFKKSKGGYISTIEDIIAEEDWVSLRIIYTYFPKETGSYLADLDTDEPNITALQQMTNFLGEYNFYELFSIHREDLLLDSSELDKWLFDGKLKKLDYPVSTKTYDIIGTLLGIGEALAEPEDLLKELLEAQLERTLTPKQIYKYLDAYVSGQEDVKKEVSLLGSVYLRNLEDANINDTKYAPTTCLIGGSTGTGKTYIVKLLSQIMKIPFYEIDVNKLTPSGYKGDNLGDITKDICSSLASEARHVTKKYIPFILFIDEVDKLLAASEDVAQFRKSVQSEMLKIIENGIQYDTSFQPAFSRPLIIFAGSFMSVRGQNEKDLTKTTTIGIGKDLFFKEKIPKLTAAKLIEYGIMPELSGRLMTVTETEDLTREMYLDILLTKKDNALSSMLKTAENLGVEVSKEKQQAIVDKVIEIATSTRTGARGLTTLIWNEIKELIWDDQQDKLMITLED